MFYNNLLATSHNKVFIYGINYSHIVLQAKYTSVIYAGFIYSGQAVWQDTGKYSH